jgi:hypothetical protein
MNIREVMSSSNGINCPESKCTVDNFEFYSSLSGNEILNNENFPPDIVDYLEGEYAAFHQLLTHRHLEFDALLEIGCGNARNIELARSFALQYFGIDFIEQVVKTASRKLKNNKWMGKIECLSVLDLHQSTTPISNNLRTLCLFPFNVFGNILDPLRVLKIMRDLKYAMLISTYRHVANQDAIMQYYTACGLTHIEVKAQKYGTLISSREGFHSTIYQTEYIQHLSNQCGFKIEITNFNKLGTLYYIR